MECGQHPDASENARGNVSNWSPYFHRRTARSLSRDTHQPTHPLCDQIEPAAIGIRPGPPKPGDRTIDQSRIQRMQRVIAETHPFHCAAAIVLDQYVSALQQTREDLASCLRLQVQGD